MIFIKTNPEGLIILAHNNPELLSEEDLKSGYLVESIPEPLPREDKVGITHYSEEKGFWFEYEDRVKTPEEILKERVEMLEKSNAELMALISTITMSPQ